MRNPCYNHVSGNLTQFEISKQIYTKGVYNKYDLTPTTKLVLVSIANHYNPKSKEAYPSQKTIAENMGISEKSVERAIKELCASGLIIYETKYVNHYKFTPKFFAAIEMSDRIRQNVGSTHRQNVGQTNKGEQINNKEFKNKFSSYNSAQKSNAISIEQTRKLLDEIEENKKKSTSPLEFTKDQAIEYINNLPKELRNSFFPTKLKQKYNL